MSSGEAGDEGRARRDAARRANPAANPTPPVPLPGACACCPTTRYARQAIADAVAKARAPLIELLRAALEHCEKEWPEQDERLMRRLRRALAEEDRTR